MPLVIIRGHVLEDIRTSRFFPDVSSRSGESPGLFYEDGLRRICGIQIGARREIVGELLVPVQALKVSTRSLVYVTSHSLVVSTRR